LHKIERPWVVMLAVFFVTEGRYALAEPTPPAKAEFGAVPVAGGGSDYGYGVGGIANYALPNKKDPPFTWALELGAFVTFQYADKSVRSPYQDVYLLFRHLDLWQGRGRLEARTSWTRESSLNYFGIGNASMAPKSQPLAPDQYERMHPEGHVRLRYRLLGPLSLELGQTFAHNRLDIGSQTRLAEDVKAPPAGFSSSFKTTAPHNLARTEFMLAMDTRDNEISPTRGQFHTLQFRVSPQIGNAFPFGYRQFNFTARAYHPIVTPRVVVAGRFVADVLQGAPPFFELARFEETNAVGGLKGVRGVLAQRYHGKVKAFANLELRIRLLGFHIGSKSYTLGAVTFFDTGRVWSQLPASRELDGTGFGLKYGVGGGLRLMQGSTFVVRGDVAWSPDARPVGAYLVAGHIF